MRPPSEWLKPPRSLLLILFLVTFVSVSALAWFGWRMLYQEQMVDTQRAQERLEQAADRITATAKGILAEAAERVGAWSASPPSESQPGGGLVLIVSGSSLSAAPAGRLLYWPFPALAPEAPATIFSGGEAIEFQQQDASKAVDWYRRLAENKDAAVRAGALMRVGRVLRNAGHAAEARAAYTELAAMGGTAVAGAPSELVARLELCELAGPGGRRSRATCRSTSRALATDAWTVCLLLVGNRAPVRKRRGGTSRSRSIVGSSRAGMDGPAAGPQCARPEHAMAR
ncbi:MAG: hypothetical protein WDO73_20575 [Ignavibacteriota bacterium]